MLCDLHRRSGTAIDESDGDRFQRLVLRKEAVQMQNGEGAVDESAEGGEVPPLGTAETLQTEKAGLQSCGQREEPKHIPKNNQRKYHIGHLLSFQ